MMMNPRRNRGTTLLLLAAYLTATTAGGWFHDHAHCAHDAASTACRHAHESDGADHEGAADGTAHVDRASADGSTLHDDDCAACRFSGQPRIAVAEGRLEPLGELSVELAVDRASEHVALPARTTHSRAPPVAG